MTQSIIIPEVREAKRLDTLKIILKFDPGGWHREDLNVRVQSVLSWLPVWRHSELILLRSHWDYRDQPTTLLD